MTTASTRLAHSRHIHLQSIFGGLLLWTGVMISLTLWGVVLGAPMAILGLGLLTTPHPH